VQYHVVRLCVIISFKLLNITLMFMFVFDIFFMICLGYDIFIILNLLLLSVNYNREFLLSKAQLVFNYIVIRDM